MKFKEKFQIIIDTVEANLQMEYKGQTYDTIVKQISQQTGINEKVIPSSFNFITDMTIGDYVKQRKMEAVLNYMKEHDDDDSELGEVAFGFGYSERSSFERAFKNSYGVTATSVLKGENIVRLTKPLTIRDVLEEDNMGINHQDFSDKTAPKQSYGESLYFKLTKKYDRDIIEMFLDCESIFGLTLEQILIIYSLLEDKSRESLFTACMNADNIEKYREIDEYSDHERSCVYLMVNYQITYEEAEELVVWANNYGVDPKDLDKEYLSIVTKHNVPGGFFLKEMPQDVFLRNKELYETFIEDSPLDLTLGEVCEQLAFIFTKEELDNPSEFIVSCMHIAVENTYSCYDTSDVFFLGEQKAVADEKHWEEYYIAADEEILYFGNHLTYERFLELTEEASKFGFDNILDMKASVGCYPEDCSFEEALEFWKGKTDDKLM